MGSACGIPTFAQAFFSKQGGSAGCRAGSPPCGARVERGDDSVGARGGSRPGRLEGLPRLTLLESLPRDDGPLTEVRGRKQKLAHFDKQCSEVGAGVYVGSEAVAKNRDTLRASGITHVVNCVGFLYPPYFEGELQYITLYLQGESRAAGSALLRRGLRLAAHLLAPRAADTPGEDILSVMYDVFDFIEARGHSRNALCNCAGLAGEAPYPRRRALHGRATHRRAPNRSRLCPPCLQDAQRAEGRVLVHCSQGVSRSATLAIAYLMWKQEAGYDEVFAAVKAARGVANPNIGFICQAGPGRGAGTWEGAEMWEAWERGQGCCCASAVVFGCPLRAVADAALLQWHKRRAAPADRCRLYRIAPQSVSAPKYLVARPVAHPQPASLDPRGAFVVQAADAVTVWAGAAADAQFVQAAERFAAQLGRYERAVAPHALVRQGSEPAAFWRALAPPEGAGSSGSSSRGSADRGGDAAVALPLQDLAAAAAAAAEECSAYDKDFEVFGRTLMARSSGNSGDDSARSARKTPRDEGGDTAISPNERLRKHARSEHAVAAAAEGEDEGTVADGEEGGLEAGASAPALGERLPDAPTPSRSRSRSPCKSPVRSPTRRISRQQAELLKEGVGSLQRQQSVGTVQQQMEDMGRTLEQAAAVTLTRAVSDVTPPRDGSLTARSEAEVPVVEAAVAQQQQVQQGGAAAGGGGRRPAVVPALQLGAAMRRA
eukprot:scaffold12.g7946.t1